MTVAGIIAVTFLVVLVGLVLWNIRGHPRGGDGSGNQYGPGSDGSGSDAGLGGGD
jgi:hypothetical protein